MKHSKFQGLAVALLAVALLAAPSTGYAVPGPLPSPAVSASISARDLKRHLSFLASTELGGRYTVSPSNLIAARYLASELEYYGYRGAAADGSYFQKVPLVFRKINFSSSSFSLTRSGQTKNYRFGPDFFQMDPQETNLAGGLVFVGYGVSSPGNGYDDYAGVDVKGKVIVVVPGMPDELRGAKVTTTEIGEPAARAHGAVGEIMIAPKQYFETWSDVKDSTDDEPLLPPKPEPKGFPELLAGPALTAVFGELLGRPAAYLQSPGGRKMEPRALEASMRAVVKVDFKAAPPAQNVVGILDGADPVLKDQFVVLSAHYDHLMTAGGQIYRGADDDGSGVVSVLEIAQAFTKDRPKRSILVVFHTGEELGLFGSEYNTDYAPVVPLSQLVCDLNIDMVGRSRPPGDRDPQDARLTDKDSIYIIGADKLSTELNQISEQTDADTEHMRFDYTYNDDANPERFYYRSDHYNYARHGIPIIFYFTGVHRDYHQPTDTVDKIDFDKMERIDRLIFATAWRIANLDHRLTVDKKPPAD
jgi:hypothetical protein